MCLCSSGPLGHPLPLCKCQLLSSFSLFEVWEGPLLPPHPALRVLCLFMGFFLSDCFRAPFIYLLCCGIQNSPEETMGMFSCFLTSCGFGLWGFHLVFKGWGTWPLEFLSGLGWRFPHLFSGSPNAMGICPHQPVSLETFLQRPGDPLSHSHRTPVSSKLYKATIPT